MCCSQKRCNGLGRKETQVDLSRFKKHGGGEPNYTQIPVTVRAIIAALDALPVDEYIDSTADLAQETGKSRATLLNHTTHPELESYRFVLQTNKVWWASKATITKLEEERRRDEEKVDGSDGGDREDATRASGSVSKKKDCQPRGRQSEAESRV